MGLQTPLRASRRRDDRAAPARPPGRRSCLRGRPDRLLEQTRHEWQNLAMPDPASEQGEHILQPLAGRLGRGADHRRHRVGADLLRRDPLPPAQRRRDPGADALQPAARDLLHDRPGHHGDRLLRAHRATPRTSSSTTTAPPDNTIEVVGQQWSWTFNYGLGEPDNRRRRPLRRRFAYDSYVYDGGTGSYIPTLWLPVDETTRFNLHSPDVIHDFGVPGFLMKMDVIPGRVNHYAHHADPDRRLHGQVLRALRRLPLADALQRQGRQPEDYDSLPPGPRGRRATLRRAAARRRRGLHAGRASSPDPWREARSDRHRVARRPPSSAPRRPLGQQIVRVLTTTDHKVIGNLYLVTSFALVPDRRRDGDAHALRAGLPGQAGRQRRALQPAVHDARHDHAAAVRDAAVLRLRQRDHAAADRLARRRVPAAEHVQLLAVPVRRPDRRLRLPDPAGRRRLRLVRLHAAVRRRPLAGRRRRPVDHGPVDGRSRHHPRRGQLHHHDHLHARARHDHVPDADLRLEHPGHQPAGADRVPGARRRAALARGRPPARRPRLRHRPRRRDPVAAPVLVLRASRGLHHRAAVLRHRHRDPAGLQPQADLRLRRPGRRHARHRDPLGRGVGAPHVRHRRGRPAVLLRHDVPDRRAHRREVLQLDRHDVGRVAYPSTRPCCGRSAS